MAKCSCSAIIEYVLIGLVTQRTHSLTEIVRRYVTKPNDGTVSVAPMHFIFAQNYSDNSDNRPQNTCESLDK